jgi:hypothetical protein
MIPDYGSSSKGAFELFPNNGFHLRQSALEFFTKIRSRGFAQNVTEGAKYFKISADQGNE